jgi:NAD dependent epimerase/dehydratase family enzyme
MTLLLTGSTGFIGSSLASFFTTGGYKIIRLLRSQSQLQSQQLENTTQKSVHWDPITGSLNLPSIEGVDAVVNLAGENIYGRWTKEKKNRILSSRVQSTKFLCKSLASLRKPPKALVSASATAYMVIEERRFCQRIIIVLQLALLIFYLKFVVNGKMPQK